MIINNYLKIGIFIAFFLLISIVVFGSNEKFHHVGKVESLTDKNKVVVIFYSKPKKNNFLIVYDNKKIGKVILVSINRTDSHIYKYRAICVVKMENKKTNLLKVGLDVSEFKLNNVFNDFADSNGVQVVEKYVKNIISKKDKRKMVLIPEGKFYLGTERWTRSEKPLQVKFLKEFYIDKCEVSNYNYYKYILSTATTFPKSWNGSKPTRLNGNLPVLVSYNEARKYANWAGKRLPTEEEWEKAARGLIFDSKGKSTSNKNYPWGDKFKKENVRKKMVAVSALSFGKSEFGVLNMVGNAQEWTSSWYNSYSDTVYVDSKYGKQYKVVRGGAWFNSSSELRLTKRDIGGIPNLYDDYRFGFRCVKDVTRANLQK